jgi:hypothetical protein
MTTSTSHNQTQHHDERQQRVTVDFNRWLAQATFGRIATAHNPDGSRRPCEVHFGDAYAGLANLNRARVMGTVHTVPDLIRQAHAVVSAEFQQQERRQLQYNFITVRVLTPDSRLLDHDSLVGRLQSSQTLWFTQTGAVKFECVNDSATSKRPLSVNCSVSHQPRVFSSRMASLFRRFREGRLSIDRFNHTFVSILMGCPIRCIPEPVEKNRYKLLDLVEPDHLSHKFQITPVKCDTLSDGGTPICIQVIFRQLALRTEEDLKEAGALVQDSDGQLRWTM